MEMEGFCRYSLIHFTFSQLTPSYVHHAPPHEILVEAWHKLISEIGIFETSVETSANRINDQ